MIVYQASKAKFRDDVVSNRIDDEIYEYFKLHLLRDTTRSEINSWRNSMQYMNNVLDTENIPADAGVAIEFQISQTSKRIDFILTGQNESNNDHVMLIELKQWDMAEVTEKDGIVRTIVGGGLREVSHPSYQVWSYASLLNGFNETIYAENITLNPCAYLHNYTADGAVDNPFYGDYIEKAPLFFKQDTLKLREFIQRFVKYGDKSNIMLRIEQGRIRPSKNLADNLSSMLKGNKEFLMIDDQKVVYENAMALAKRAGDNNKQVLIVQGGPGTGKSVIAINLLVALTKLGLLTQYVTKNAAPRAVYEAKLKDSFKKIEISNFFTGSGAFTNNAENVYDALIVDEAHRLNAKSGMFKNLGENQIKEIINASRFSIFFIDEDQKVTLHDIGTKDEIRSWAKAAAANVTELQLESQFRCNGSDGYLAWLDNILQIRKTANETLENVDYDFRVVDSPAELRDLIFEKNKINNKARLVAGYCWDWASKTDSKQKDIVFPEFDFAMKWNLSEDGPKWIIEPNSVNEIGCIHTCQGLEADYIGVIIGEDLIVRDDIVITDPSKRSKNDSSIRGYKSLMSVNKEKTQKLTDEIIKNTYRTLMTRGMKGCYIWFVDEATNDYFKQN
jgi:DUF2075 family protein